MKKTKLKKSKKKEPKKIPSPDGKEEPFDFGGLPQRDLKKNLGCG